MTVMDNGTLTSQRPLLPPLALLIICVLVALLLPAVTFVADPLIRSDDYPALLGLPDLFYMKTLNEGRWLNYIWHLRGVVTPAWLNFLVYNLFWAIYLGGLVHLALGAKTALWRKVFVAVIAGLAIPQVLISLWFNTLIPGLGVAALYALLSIKLSSRASRSLLLIFVPIALTAYTTYPFLLLALCLLRQDFDRSWKDLAGLLGLFLVSFILGLLLIFGLNYLEHGVFGVVMADWRSPNPVQDLASLKQNLPILWHFLDELLLKASLNNPFLSLLQTALFGAAIWLTAKRDPLKAIYPLTGLVLCLAMVLVPGLKSGVALPMRTGGFAWVYYAVFLGWLSLELQDRGRDRLGRNILFVVAATYVAIAGMERHFSGSWQRYSRALAAEIGPGEEPILITGTYRSLPSAKLSQLHSYYAVKFRLEHLTGRQVYVCEFEEEACQDLPEDLKTGLNPDAVHQHHALSNAGDNLVVLFSPTPIMQEKLEHNRK